jgi:dipeptide/tripeptide permease
MRLEYILIGFGILLCLAGIGYLAAQYVKYLSEAGRIVSLLLTIGMFAFLGKYFESLGW